MIKKHSMRVPWLEVRNLDAVVDLNHVVVEHVNAAEADGGAQVHPVGPSRAVDGVLTGADLHIGDVPHPHRVARAWSNDLALLVIHRRRIHLGDGEVSGHGWGFGCADGHRIFPDHPSIVEKGEVAVLEADLDAGLCLSRGCCPAHQHQGSRQKG